MQPSSSTARAVAARLCSTEDLARLHRARLGDAGHGYDVLGLHPAWVASVLAFSRPIYGKWFRVHSRGIENIPASGPAIVAANHGGLLPFDAAMLWTDLVLRSEPPRIPRAVADHFVPRLPAVSTLFSRVGVVGGSRGNARALLERNELLMVFPEGTRGIGKPRKERYRLQHWSVGHIELAIRHRAPIVPVAIVGAEEQFPFLVQARLHPFGSPYLPIGFPIPLPVRYHITYGAPIALHEGWGPEAADDPQVVREGAERVRNAVATLIEQTLNERTGLFR